MQALHRFRFACGFSQSRPHEPMTMNEGKRTAASMALQYGMDCQMYAFNDELRQWEYLATYHDDGSWHDSFGDYHPQS